MEKPIDLFFICRPIYSSLLVMLLFPFRMSGLYDVYRYGLSLKLGILVLGGTEVEIEKL